MRKVEKEDLASSPEIWARIEKDVKTLSKRATSWTDDRKLQYRELMGIETKLLEIMSEHIRPVEREIHSEGARVRVADGIKVEG